ncbi:hypothetical protein ABEP16_21505 [Priestia aryabhattai]|uniref:BC1872 family protein n=1 Tax=Priestia aryabhattai TaxID=412384 RepID=UPI003D27272A
MNRQWNTLTNREKNLIIARDVLAFECFEDEEGIQWYNKHYSMGHWRYCTDLKDAIDLSKRILNDDHSFKIIMSKNRYECHVIITKQPERSLLKAYGESLPDVICLASVYYKGIDINVCT